MAINLYPLHSLYTLKTLENPSFAEVGNLRKITILDWVYRFRYTSIPVLEVLFGDIPKSALVALLSRMEKRGEIRKFSLVTGFTKVGFCLREKGFLLLQQHFENRTFGRFFTETATLSASNFVHDLAIQHVIAKQIATDTSGKKIGFANEWEIRSYYSESKTKILDAIVERVIADKKKRFGIEVELSPKTTKRLKLALYASKKLVEDGEIHAIQYLCPTKGLADAVNRQIKESGLDPNLFLTAVPAGLKQLIAGGRA
jgi:hypothetical protein